MRQVLAVLVLTCCLGSPAVAAPNGSCATVPYRSDDRLINIPVRVNGGVLSFDVDSGAPYTVIDSAVARRLGLKILRAETTTGAGHGSVPMLHAAPVVVGVGEAKLRVADPRVIDLSHTGTSLPIEGLIGADFFNAFIVRIDPVERTVAFCDPESFVAGSRGATIPLIEKANRLFVQMTLTLSNGITATHTMRVDTGSDDSVSDDLVRRSPIRRKSVQGVGLGKSYVDYSGVFASVQIGPYSIANVWGPSNDRPAVGMEILRRFVLTFDAPRGKLTLEPTAYLHDPVPSPAP